MRSQIVPHFPANSSCFDGLGYLPPSAPALAEASTAEEEVVHALEGLNVVVPAGSLVAVVGAVSTGKTSLLASIWKSSRSTWRPEPARWNMGGYCLVGCEFLLSLVVLHLHCYCRR